MTWNWPKSIGFSWSWALNWPDASRDKCRACAVERRFHEHKDHGFLEEKEK